MGGFKADYSIDLHGVTPEVALERLRRFVETNRGCGKSVEVIHGQGRYVLRDRVRDWGRRSPLVKQIWAGEEVFLPGGGGVTVFFL